MYVYISLILLLVLYLSVTLSLFLCLSVCLSVCCTTVNTPKRIHLVKLLYMMFRTSIFFLTKQR